MDVVVPAVVAHPLLRDKALVSEVLLVFVRVVSAYHRRRARHRGIAGGQTGAVTAIQRVG